MTCRHSIPVTSPLVGITNQEASSQSSNEDTPRPIDLRAIGSPTFAPLSPIQIERSPPEEETKRESPKSETETPKRRLRYSTPLRGDPPSPLPTFEEPEPPTMPSTPPTIEELEAVIAALPTKAEYDAMVKEIEIVHASSSYTPASIIQE